MTADANATAADQLAAGAVVLGLVALATCWWFPFGPAVGVVGAGLGLAAWCAGRRALTGTVLAATAAGAGLLLAWDYWRRLLGV